VVHLHPFLASFVLRSRTVSLHVWKHLLVSSPYLDFYSRSETEFLIENDFRTLNSPRTEFSRQFILYVLVGNIHKKWNIPANLYHMFWREIFTISEIFPPIYTICFGGKHLQGVKYSRQFIPYVLAGNIHVNWNIPAHLYHTFWRETFTRGEIFPPIFTTCFGGKHSQEVKYSRQFMPYVLAGNIHKKWNIPAHLYHTFWRETFTSGKIFPPIYTTCFGGKHSQEFKYFRIISHCFADS
jgi:hypothetical protein